MVTGTISSAVKLQALDTKWQQKKNDLKSGRFQKEMTPEERMLADYKEQMEKQRESNSHADLYNKLKSGGKLSSEEISYLEQNDPEALRRYREDQAEQKAYERDLKNCKTKDEVDRVKMNKLGNFATQAKNIANDPYIPLDKKLELMNQLNDKVCRVQEAHLEFVDSQKYKDMPTENELLQENVENAVENIEHDEKIETPEQAEIISEFEENDIEESPEEKLKKAEREDKTEETVKNENVDSGVSFDTVTKSIQNFVFSAGVFDSKLDISL